ncbi:MAG: hypothetical protein IKF38_04560 [Clostridia bacterium]|nr:hypothetical protein [Clostridia bacterium]
MAEKKNPTLKKARQEMTYLTGDAEVKRLAFLREKWEMDRISDINNVKREAKEETKKETAKKMLEKGIGINTIIEITGLTKEEIEKL